MELLLCNHNLRGGPTDGWDNGDVILVRGDDFRWGRKEVGSRKFRIIKQPGSDPTDFEYLLEPGTNGCRRWKVLSNDVTVIDKNRTEGDRLL